MSKYPFTANGLFALPEQTQKILEIYLNLYHGVVLPPLTDNMMAIAESIRMQIDSGMALRIINATAPLLTSLETIRLQMSNLTLPQIVPLSEETVAALQRLQTYVPEKQKVEYQELLQPEPAQKDRIFTLERTLSIVSLLFTLFTLIMTCLPEKEAQLSNANEAAMLENQREANELLSEQNRLLQDIADALQALRDDCDAVPELSSAIDDLLQGAPDASDIAPDAPDLDAQNKDAQREQPQQKEQ